MRAIGFLLSVCLASPAFGACAVSGNGYFVGVPDAEASKVTGRYLGGAAQLILKTDARSCVMSSEPFAVTDEARQLSEIRHPDWKQIPLEVYSRHDVEEFMGSLGETSELHYSRDEHGVDGTLLTTYDVSTSSRRWVISYALGNPDGRVVTVLCEILDPSATESTRTISRSVHFRPHPRFPACGS